jgi:hypothetical protein
MASLEVAQHRLYAFLLVGAELYRRGRRGAAKGEGRRADPWCSKRMKNAANKSHESDGRSIPPSFCGRRIDQSRRRASLRHVRHLDVGTSMRANPKRKSDFTHVEISRPRPTGTKPRQTRRKPIPNVNALPILARPAPALRSVLCANRRTENATGRTRGFNQGHWRQLDPPSRP